MPLPSFIFDAQKETPESLARRRALAEAMLQRGTTGVASNIGEGLAQFGQALAGRIGVSRADSAMASRRNTALGLVNKVFGGGFGGGTPAAPVAGKVPTAAPSAAPVSVPKNNQAFVNSILPAAIEHGQRIGVDPRIIVAQAALESNWGKSAPGNNYFGIKSHGKAGGQTFKTHEVINGKTVAMNDSFRTFNDPADSVAGYADFLTQNKRYKPMLGAKGLEAQLAALGQSGYATDPNYTKKLSSIISKLPANIAGAPAVAKALQGQPGIALQKPTFQMGGAPMELQKGPSPIGGAPMTVQPASEISNAEYLGQFKDAIPSMAKTFAPGAVAPFNQPVPQIVPASGPPPAMPQNAQPGLSSPMVPQMAPQPAAQPQPAMAPAAPQMAPQRPMTAYQRMMAQSLGKEAGGLAAPPNRTLMASVMGQGQPRQGGGILSGLFTGQGLQAPQTEQAAAIPSSVSASPSSVSGGGQPSSAQLQSVIFSEDFAYLPETTQKVLIDRYQRAIEQENPDPAAAADLQLKQLQIQEKQKALQDQGIETTVVNGVLVNSRTGEVVFDARDKTPEPPKSRDVRRGNQTVTQRWDGQKWIDEEVGDAFKTTPDTIVNGADLKEEKIYGRMEQEADAAKAAMTGLSALRQAKEALPGAITGAGANQRLQLQKIASLLGVGDTQAIVDTETFRSAIAPQVAAMLKATVGSTQISNADREFAEKAAGGAITLDAKSIERLTNIMYAANSEVVRGFNARLDGVYPDDPANARPRASLAVPNVPKAYASPIGPRLPTSDLAPAAPGDAMTPADLRKKYGLE
jgi:hypothetical protein